MDSSIPALVIGAILLLGATFLSRSSITTYDRLGQQIKAVEARAGEQSRTRLTLLNPALDGPHNTLTFELLNDGSTRISDWARLDVIFTYQISATTTVGAWMTYTSGAPGANQWTLSSIISDTIEPGILNPGETATITVEISPAAASNRTHQITVAVENGVSTSVTFTD